MAKLKTAKKTEEPTIKIINKAEAARKFYQNQFEVSKGHAYRSKYLHFVAYIFNEPNHENIIQQPGNHIISIEKQITFKDYIKLFDYCKARNTTPIVLLDSWLNNKAYSKGKVSVYATLRSWASKETVKQSNL